LAGNPSLASWLERSVALGTSGRVIASDTTGIARIDLRGAPGGARKRDWVRDLERALGAFGLAAPTRTSAPARRAQARPEQSAAPERPAVAVRPVAPERRPPAETRPAHHAGDLASVLGRLGTEPARGLEGSEAAARLGRDGPNEIRDVTARPDLEILADQFSSLPVALLAGSAVLSLATRARGDAAAIGLVLAANAGIGFFTERQAERTVSALRKLAPRAACVVRGGRLLTVPARELAVGDVLVLEAGDPVAADARVIESHRLSANEAALTGESLPVRKEPCNGLAESLALGERRNLLHMGSVISGGAGRAVVVATGERTALGEIRALAQAAEAPRTRMQLELDDLGRRLALGASACCAAVFAVGLLRGRAALPLLRTVVSLGVAAIPEGLPAVATSLLATGIRTLQKRNVFARRLDAIENLGAVDVVGFDKTGTLTANRMTAARAVIGGALIDLSGVATLPADWLAVCALCCDVEARAGGGWSGSSTEVALVELAVSGGADVPALRTAHPRLEVKQRSEHHPYMVTLHAAPDGRAIVAMKGRPAEVLERCTQWFDGARVAPLTKATRGQLLEANDALAGAGQRVLALAIKRQKSQVLGVTGGMTWLGLVGLSDPVRPGVASSIARFRRAGIRPIMLTGDQPGTARAVAREIGLDAGRVADMAAQPEDAAKLEALAVENATFARTSPAMKLQLIRALQARGHVVAMTGDGINDGPALKSADVGVAMGVSGTDFALAMSDLVLQDDHPDGLLHAIAEGRTSYLNVKKAVRYLIATNASELGLMSLSALAGLPDPLDPLALLWTNLITDVSPAIALGLEPPEPDVLERPPFPRAQGLLDRSDWRTVAVDGSLLTAASLAAFLYGYRRYGDSPRARTIAFAALTSAQLLYAMSARSEAPLGRLREGGARRNVWLTRTVAASLGAQLAAVLLPPLRSALGTVPLSLGDLAVVATATGAPVLAREALKRARAATASESRPGGQA
jgi:Ca2+-transporting ATPase